MSCPFLGLKDDPATSLLYPSVWNYCNLAKPPYPPNNDHQTMYCLGDAHKTCPVFLQTKAGPLPQEIRVPGARPERVVNRWMLTSAGLFILLLALIGWQVFAHGSIPVDPNLTQPSITPTELAATASGTISPQPATATITATSSRTPTVSPAPMQRYTPTLGPTSTLPEACIPPTISNTLPSVTQTVGQSNSFSVIATGSAPLSYQWQKDTSNVGTNSNTFTINSVVMSDAGSYTVIVSNPCGNSGPSNAAVLTVNKATPDVTTWPIASGIVYGDALSASTLSSGAASVPGSFDFSSPSDKPNAGTPSVSVIFTPTDTVNYNTVSGAVNISVARADPACSIGGYTGAYDGNSHAASGSCTGVNGLALGGTLDLGTSFTDVPGGTANWSFAPFDTTNYNPASGSVNINISKADANCSIAGWTGSYDGNPHGATGSCTGVGGAPLSGLDLGASFTDVPGGTAYWNFTPSDTNYNGQSGSVDISIN